MSELTTLPDIPVAFHNNVAISWRGEHRFSAARPGSPSVTIDASAKEGPSPVDALLIGLGTCTAVDVVDIMAKRRTPVASLDVDIVAARADAVPKRLIGVLITYRITGEGIERVHAERAAELAVDKYCSVRMSLDPNMPVTWRVVLNGEAAGPA
ncbi:MAG: OsmC family protein [Gemmatimonadaceae bacterium]|nr:OsmC family protein [Gemmatimonadaceae bacterium]